MTDDLVKRLRLIGEKRLQCTACYKFIETADEAADRIEELEHLFDLRWAADMRAIRLWQSAHPDQPRTWPDHADLGTWCLSRIEKLEAALRRIKDMHDGLVDDLEERDDRTYFIVIGALEGKDD